MSSKPNSSSSSSSLPPISSSSSSSTDLPQALFGAWDWTNYQTTLGAILTICSFSFLAGILATEEQIQRIPVSSLSDSYSHKMIQFSQYHQTNISNTTSDHDSSSSSTLLSLFFWIFICLITHFLCFVRTLIVSLICSSTGELALFLSLMLISGVDIERILGSIKLREALLVLGVQRILLQAIFVNLPFLLFVSSSSTSTSSWTTMIWISQFWSLAPSASWMALTLTMIRRILIPPRRCFRLFGLPLDEQSISDLFAIQIIVVSEDPWCFLSCACVALLNCSPSWSPIHLRSRVFFSASSWLWEDDVKMKGATVLVRFLPSTNSGNE